MASTIGDPTKDAQEGKGTPVSMEERIRMKITHKQVFTWQSRGPCWKLWPRWTGAQGADQRQLPTPQLMTPLTRTNEDTKSIRTLYCQTSPCPEALPQWLPIPG